MTDKTLHIRRWTKREDAQQNDDSKLPKPGSGKELVALIEKLGFTVEDGEDLERFMRDIRKEELR